MLALKNFTLFSEGESLFSTPSYCQTFSMNKWIYCPYTFYVHVHVYKCQAIQTIHEHVQFVYSLQRFFGLLVMIVGIVSYGYIVATVAASLANADSGRARYQEKLKAIENYLKVR